ncbi:MAG: aminotransferase class I/II-fold pyridoxal phosphate-dependent enzyme [Candidatus Caldarchaeum sp.]
MHVDELERLRSEARQLAVDMVRLLAMRRRVVSKIAEVKRSTNVDTVQPDVEAAVRRAMLEEAVKHGIPAETVNRLATVIFADAVEMQSKPSKQLTHMDILRRAVEMQRNGREVQRLEVGEPDLGAPQQVRYTVGNAVVEGYARYADSRGIPELRTAIAEQIHERYGYEAAPYNVIVTPGGRFAIYLAMKTLLAEGDEIIVIDPSWPMYKQCARFVGARPVAVRTRFEDGWTPDPCIVEERISKSTKAILLNYPNNPTGKTLDRKSFSKIVDIARDNNLTLISDEVYIDYTRGDGPVSVLDGWDVNFILIQSFSKSYGMTGYRVGYVVANEALVSKMASIIGLVLTCVPEFIQYGALKALSLKETPKQYAEIMMRRMDVAVRELEKIGASFYKPDGGMYVFPRINTGGADGMELAFELLESKGVAVAPGSIFGGYDDFIRISLGASEESIAKGIRLLGEFLAEKGLT